MNLPEIVIDLKKIKKNTEAVINIAQPFGVEIVGVTKSFLAEPYIAGAMIDGGIKMLADSRLENLQRLKEEYPKMPLMLLRLPGISQVEDTVSFADVSLNSEFEVIQALSDEALRQGKRHRVILMVDLGDLREGIWPENLPELVEQTVELRGIELEGLGVNLACYGGVVPTTENLGQLVELFSEIKSNYGYEMSVVSGGNSASLPLLLDGTLPKGINQLRIGEGIALGRETVNRELLPGAVSDAFILRAEVLECQEKPTVPLGETAEDAFGETPEFADEGWRRRGILALGRQDVPIDGLSPRDERLKVFGASSDHLIVDLTDAPELNVGSIIEFDLRYGGLLGAMTSPYVYKRFLK